MFKKLIRDGSFMTTIEGKARAFRKNIFLDRAKKVKANIQVQA